MNCLFPEIYYFFPWLYRMSILSSENLSISFGVFDLFKGISISIANDAKIGLIGPNGIGKTSLLLLLSGINAPTTGRVHIARGRKIGYLRQEAVEAFIDRDNTLYGEMLTVFGELLQMREELAALEEQLGTSYSDNLLERYGNMQAEFEHLGGYTFDQRIRQTLSGLRLGEGSWDMPLQQLSGGQKTRALLARLLLEKPDLLILDEPTNHLDIEAVEWLERILREWQGAVLIVSHDRYFLDNTINTIWEMSQTGIDIYAGNYSAYLLQRLERWEYYQRVFEEEKNRLLGEVDFIQRNWVRASTHARALGLLRRLSRDLAIVENYGIMALRDGRNWSEFHLRSDRPLEVLEAVREVNALRIEQARPAIIRPRLPGADTSGNIVIQADYAEIGYPDHFLFSINRLELKRGECAALVGPNGSGKTTFLKVLTGQINALKGEVRLGANLKIGYFAQAHSSLNGPETVIDELISHREMLPSEARNYLAAYQFRDEDVFKPLSALSGGERARLALAILALDGANLLLLDEPTNHLDIPAREALQEVLDSFKGTILLVSHDRYLVDRLATQIWDLREAKLVIFRGTYREYVLRSSSASISGTKAQTILLPKPMFRDNSRETRRRKEELEKIEERIREREAELQKLSKELEKAGEKALEKNSKTHEKLHSISMKISQVQAELDSLMADWERLVL